MTDDIRKKHEQQVTYTKEKQGNSPYLFQSIHSTLTIADVDALFAALDAERGKVEHMREGVRKLIEEHEYSAFCMSPKEVVMELKKILKGGGDEQ